MRWLLAAALLSASTAANGQAVMDGTDRAIPSAQLADLQAAIRAQALDPYGAQITSLALVNPGLICGRVNLRNAAGGYIGFRRFGFEAATRTWTVEPDIDGRQYSREELQRQLADVEAVIAACRPRTK